MRWLYWCSWFLSYLGCKVWFRSAAHGRENVPRRGALVLVCNHASHIDPLILGTGVPRRCWYVARSTLGDIPLVGLWMRAIGIIFIDRKAPGRDSITRAVEVLDRGEVLGMFPEGTRTRDGRLQPFQRGLMLLLKKSQATVVPAGIRGSFSAFPPGKSIPRPRKCSVHFGRARSAAEVLAPGGLEALRCEIAELSDSELA